jgi:hypothetical protein
VGQGHNTTLKPADNRQTMADGISASVIVDPVIDALKRGQASPSAEAPPASKAAGAGGEGQVHKCPSPDSQPSPIDSGLPALPVDDFSSQQPVGSPPEAFEAAPLPDSSPALKTPLAPVEDQGNAIQFAYTRFITRPRKYG